MTKYTELWNGIKNSIEKINKSIDKSDNSVPLNKALKLQNMTIIVESVFEENASYKNAAIQ